MSAFSDNSENDIVYDTNVRDKNKTIRSHRKLNTTKKNKHKNYMRTTLSALNKQKTKYQSTDTLPRMIFSKSLSNASLNRSELIKNKLNINTTMIKTREYEWNTEENYHDDFNHFNNCNFGSDPFDHFE